MKSDKKTMQLGQTSTSISVVPGRKDAMHVPVMVVHSRLPIKSGQPINFVNHLGEVTFSIDCIASDGIADPFLGKNIPAGERFLMLVNPRKVENIRHDWDTKIWTEPQTPATCPDGAAAATGVANPPTVMAFTSHADQSDYDDDYYDDGCRGCDS